MVDCWVNFDCSTDSEDMFERLIAFLTRVSNGDRRSEYKLILEKGVYPVGPPKQDGSSHLFEGLENVQLISLEILLSFVNAMTERFETGSEGWPEVSEVGMVICNC
jgi:brefeldin A-resistance guanine nucleotide exchange factor 1